MNLRAVTDRDVLLAYLSSAKTPLERVRGAIKWATEQVGVRILHGDYGVIASAGGWEVDERRRPVGVSPLGAVVLAYQPDKSRDLPDPAAEALGVSIHWAEGLADGFDKELTAHYLGSLARQQYLQGVEAGFALRFELTTNCSRCGSRHFKADRCPLCEELPAAQTELLL